MNLTIRDATPEDLPFLRRLFVSSREATFGNLPLPEPQKEALIDMQYRARGMQYRSTYPTAIERLILVDGEAVGALYWESLNEGCQIIDFGILAEFRGQGIGSAVLTRILKEAEGRPVRLSVEVSNPARRLYQRMGFRQETDEGMFVRMVCENQRPL